MKIKRILVFVLGICVLYCGWWFYREFNPPSYPDRAPQLARVDPKLTHELQVNQGSIAARFLRVLHRKEPQGNVAFSPSGIHDIATALWLGADGEVAKNLEELIGTTAYLSLQQYRSRFDDISSRGILMGGTGLWVQNPNDLTPSYRQRFEETFAAEPHTANLRGPTIPDVDRWIEERTNGKVKSYGPVAAGPKPALLLDARYFHDQWYTRFDPNRTKDRPFTLASGKDAMVPTMEGENLSYGFTATEEFARLSFEFRNHLTFLAIVPLQGIEKLLESPILEAALVPGYNSLALERSSRGRIAMPKWKLDKQIDLESLFHDAGLPRVFGPSAARNFRKMFPHGDCYPRSGKQRIGIAIDEEGAEAYTYTSTLFAVKASKPREKNFVIDQPFIFAIADPGGAILFAGIIMDPRL